MRCLTGNHQCSLSYLIRRKCTRCRLERCFTVGMKKEFILTEEEKQNRKKRSDQNQMNSSNKSQLTLLTRNENNNVNFYSFENLSIFVLRYQQIWIHLLI